MRGKLGLGALLAAVLGVAAPAFAQAPAPAEGKPGGVLRLVLREDLPQGFAIHESATNSVTWPAMPCYSNLVIFDQLKRVGRVDRFAHYPSVKNLILNQVTDNGCRHQETWLDK